MPKETILVVDDERLVRWSLQQKLEQWGYNVSVAEDGATALGRVQIDNPDLITLDVRLPDMTGIEVLSELRRRNVHVPVIVITAFGVVDDAVRSLKLGAYDFIEKPINFEKLENALRNALETRRLRTEVARTHEIQRSEFSVDRIIGISGHIMDVELCGHEKGAFTDARTQKKGMFEMADGGSLFLDEISELNLGMQAKLL